MWSSDWPPIFVLTVPLSASFIGFRVIVTRWRRVLFWQRSKLFGDFIEKLFEGIGEFRVAAILLLTELAGC